jgi:hypothetical protein
LTGSTISPDLAAINNVAFVSGTVYLTPVFLRRVPGEQPELLQGATIPAGTHGWFRAVRHHPQGRR